MSCTQPRLVSLKEDGTGIQFASPSLVSNFSGKSPPEGFFYISCRQCVSCRLDHSREWALRCVHEAQMNEHNAFLTLTYDNENLPFVDSHEGIFPTLDPDHLTKFWKDLRSYIDYYVGDEKFKYFACGEYGELYGRPHYHACVFNLDVTDKDLISCRNGTRLYRSDILEDIWSRGQVRIGEVSFQSAAYVARYVMKKRRGDAVRDYAGRVPEFQRQSQGLSKRWFEEHYLTDVYAHDYCVLDGKKVKVPRYYDKQLEKIDPNRLVEIKEVRRNSLQDVDWNEFSVARLETKDYVKSRQAEQLWRPYENQNPLM